MNHSSTILGFTLSYGRRITLICVLQIPIVSCPDSLTYCIFLLGSGRNCNVFIYECYFSAVRYGRVPKRSRERSTDEPSRVTTSDADQSDTETKQLAVYDIILSVSQAHHANCG